MGNIRLFRLIDTPAQIGSIAICPFMDMAGGFHQTFKLDGGIWLPYYYRLFGGEFSKLFSGKRLPNDYAPARKLEKIFDDDYGPTKGIEGDGSPYKPWTWNRVKVKHIAAGYKGGLLWGDISTKTKAKGKEWIKCLGIKVPYLSWSVYTAVHLVTVNLPGKDCYPLDQKYLKGMKVFVYGGGWVSTDWLEEETEQ